MATITVQASDTSTAMEEIALKLGEDAMILSTTKKNGKVIMQASNDAPAARNRHSLPAQLQYLTLTDYLPTSWDRSWQSRQLICQPPALNRDAHLRLLAAHPLATHRLGAHRLGAHRLGAHLLHRQPSQMPSRHILSRHWDFWQKRWNISRTGWQR